MQEWLQRFAENFFTKMGRCGSIGQSVILSACITAFCLVIEANQFYTGCTSSHNIIFARPAEHVEFMPVLISIFIQLSRLLNVICI